MSDAHAHHDDHPDFLAHHWETPQQQFEAGKLGMWLFLATEVLLFGGLFCAYSVWRGNHPELFKFGSEYLDTTMGAINTAVLITSSLTMAMAVTFAQQNKQAMLKLCLVLTLLGAFGFLVIKYFEYTHKFHEGWYPGVKFYEKPHDAHGWDPEADVYYASGLPAVELPAVETVDPAQYGLPSNIAVELSTVPHAATPPQGIALEEIDELASHKYHGEMRHPGQRPDRPANAHMFFNIYFMMTGLHGIHVVIGAIVIIWLLVLSMKGRFNDKYFTPVDLGGLYWHVVDLIWIFLFPLFYLI